MAKVIVGVVGVFLFVGGMFAQAPPAHAGDIECTGVVTGAVPGNVIVRTFCHLDVAHVDGNVKVLRDGRLLVESSTITGDIQSDGGRSIQIANSIIYGDLEAKNAPPAALPGDILFLFFNQFVGGDVKFENNSVRIALHNNFLPTGAIRGNVQLFKNTGGGDVLFNTIGGNLECKENIPPITQASNFVAGNTYCPG